MINWNAIGTIVPTQLLGGSGGGGGGSTGANVGAASGEVYRDNTGAVLNFRTIGNSDGTISVTTVGNEIVIDNVDRGDVFGPGAPTQQYQIAFFNDATGTLLGAADVFVENIGGRQTVYTPDALGGGFDLALKAANHLTPGGTGALAEVIGGDGGGGGTGGEASLVGGHDTTGTGGNAGLYPGRGTNAASDGMAVIHRTATDNRATRLAFEADNGAFITAKAPAAPTAYDMVLPSAQGAASTVLTNDGSGNLSWATPGSSSLLTTNTDLYLATATGNDANDGLTALTPVATLGRIWEIINSFGVIAATVTVHVADGAYALTAPEGLNFVNQGLFALVGDGAGQPGLDGFTVQRATALPSSVSNAVYDTRIDIGAGLAPATDAYSGMIVEIVAGTGAGQRNTIVRNTGSGGTGGLGQIWLASQWNTPLDGTSQFRVVTPAVSFTLSANTIFRGIPLVVSNIAASGAFTLTIENAALAAFYGFQLSNATPLELQNGNGGDAGLLSQTQVSSFWGSAPAEPWLSRVQTALGLASIAAYRGYTLSTLDAVSGGGQVTCVGTNVDGYVVNNWPLCQNSYAFFRGGRFSTIGAYNSSYVRVDCGTSRNTGYFWAPNTSVGNFGEATNGTLVFIFADVASAIALDAFEYFGGYSFSTITISSNAASFLSHTIAGTNYHYFDNSTQISINNATLQRSSGVTGFIESYNAKFYLTGTTVLSSSSELFRNSASYDSWFSFAGTITLTSSSTITFRSARIFSTASLTLSCTTLTFSQTQWNQTSGFTDFGCSTGMTVTAGSTIDITDSSGTPTSNFAALAILGGSQMRITRRNTGGASYTCTTMSVTEQSKLTVLGGATTNGAWSGTTLTVTDSTLEIAGANFTSSGNSALTNAALYNTAPLTFSVAGASALSLSQGSKLITSGALSVSDATGTLTVNEGCLLQATAAVSAGVATIEGTIVCSSTFTLTGSSTLTLTSCDAEFAGGLDVGATSAGVAISAGAQVKITGTGSTVNLRGVTTTISTGSNVYVTATTITLAGVLTVTDSTVVWNHATSSFTSVSLTRSTVSFLLGIAVTTSGTVTVTGGTLRCGSTVSCEAFAATDGAAVHVAGALTIVNGIGTSGLALSDAATVVLEGGISYSAASSTGTTVATASRLAVSGGTFASSGPLVVSGGSQLVFAPAANSGITTFSITDSQATLSPTGGMSVSGTCTFLRSTVSASTALTTTSTSTALAWTNSTVALAAAVSANGVGSSSTIIACTVSSTSSFVGRSLTVSGGDVYFNQTFQVNAGTLTINNGATFFCNTSMTLNGALSVTQATLSFTGASSAAATTITDSTVACSGSFSTSSNALTISGSRWVSTSSISAAATTIDHSSSVECTTLTTTTLDVSQSYVTCTTSIVNGGTLTAFGGAHITTAALSPSTSPRDLTLQSGANMLITGASTSNIGVVTVDNAKLTLTANFTCASTSATPLNVTNGGVLEHTSGTLTANMTAAGAATNVVLVAGGAVLTCMTGTFNGTGSTDATGLEVRSGGVVRMLTAANITATGAGYGVYANFGACWFEFSDLSNIVGGTGSDQDFKAGGTASVAHTTISAVNNYVTDTAGSNIGRAA